MKKILLAVGASTILLVFSSCQQDKPSPAGQSEQASQVASEAQPIPKEDRAFTWNVTSMPSAMKAGSSAPVTVVIKNAGPSSWPGDKLKGTGKPLRLGYHWIDASDKATPDDGHRAEIPFNVPPGGETALVIQVQAPATAGKYMFQPDVVQEFVAWFGNYMPASQPGIPVEVTN